MPYLTFGITCWGQACNTYLNKILVLQKKALRFMYFVDRKTHAIPLFLDAKILPVSFLYYRSTAVLLHDIHTNLAPKNLVNLFVIVSDVLPIVLDLQQPTASIGRNSILNYKSMHFKFMVQNCGTRYQPH